MGVLACDRLGCGNIMCDRRSSRYGYICDECYQQLRDSSLSIACFMETDKSSMAATVLDRGEELDAEFVLRDINEEGL